MDDLTQQLTDAGKIIEAGFEGCVAMAFPRARGDEKELLRSIFFAGAQHLFASILNILDPGEEPTEKDLKRLDMIQIELDVFIKEFEFKHITKPSGSA